MIKPKVSHYKNIYLSLSSVPSHKYAHSDAEDDDDDDDDYLMFAQ